MNELPEKENMSPPGASAKKRLKSLLMQDRKVITDNFSKKQNQHKTENDKKFGFFKLSEGELKKLEESSDKLDLGKIIRLDK